MFYFLRLQGKAACIENNILNICICSAAQVPFLRMVQSRSKFFTLLNYKTKSLFLETRSLQNLPLWHFQQGTPDKPAF
jgi:hypothetical protein